MAQAVAAPVTAPAVTAAAGAEVRSKPRINALDFTKGALVVTMVVYHWLNYFVVLNWDIYRYLRFLTPSFILIAGYIVTSVYGGKFARDRRTVRARLLSRGAKLLVLFTVLNVLLAIVGGSTVQAKRGWTDYLFGVYVSGNGRAAFDVLVPIAYVLLIGPIVLELKRKTDAAPLWVALFGLGAAAAASLSGHSSVNLELVAMGCLGMAIGRHAPQTLMKEVQRPLALAAAYALYLVAITVWNVVFPLQVAGVCLTLAVLFWTGSRLADRPGLQWVIELGKYSLLGYIAQVAILQILKRGLRPSYVDGWLAVVPFAITLLLTVAAVYATRLGRQHSAAIDRAYRLIFA